MSLPRYKKYKKTGTSWLGEIPAHWGIKRLKWFIQRNDGGVWGEDPDGENDTLVLRSTEQSVDGYWRLDEPARRKLTESEKNSALLELGDLLVTKSSGSSLHIGKTTLVDEKVAQLSCCYSNFMQRVRLKNEFLPKLAWYAMNNEVARLQFDLLSNSTTGLANLNGSMISEILLPIPSREEQESIIIFLDRETAKIDALIAEQEKLLALLAEKRQATISHAVTKGLNPDAPMKDSGVEWLGEVPAHWAVKPLKHCVDYQEGPGILADDFHDEGVPLIRLAGVQSQWATLDGCNYLDPKKVWKKWQHFRLNRGDLLISASASMGTICEVGDESVGAVPYTGIIRMRGRVGEMVKDFLRHMVVSRLFLTQIDLLKAGATIQHYGPTHLSQMFAVQPPEIEQQEIANFIDKRIEKFDELSIEAGRAVTILLERRSALISAAVTGQIDVRNAVAEEKTASDDR